MTKYVRSLHSEWLSGCLNAEDSSYFFILFRSLLIFCSKKTVSSVCIGKFSLIRQFETEKVLIVPLLSGKM